MGEDLRRRSIVRDADELQAVCDQMIYRAKPPVAGKSSGS